MSAWIKEAKLRSENFLFPSRIHVFPHLGTRQYARIVDNSYLGIDIDDALEMAEDTEAWRHRRRTIGAKNVALSSAITKGCE